MTTHAPSENSQPSAPDSSAESVQNSYDVAVIGGGAGGLAASIALARSLRSVVVIDAGQLRNSASAHAHNVLGHEGIRPQDLVAKGRAEAAEYGVTFIDATVQKARTIDSEPNPAEAAPRYRFELATSAGVDVRTRRIIIATGLSDELPDIPGLAEGGRDRPALPLLSRLRGARTAHRGHRHDGHVVPPGDAVLPAQRRRQLHPPQRARS